MTSLIIFLDNGRKHHMDECMQAELRGSMHDIPMSSPSFVSRDNKINSLRPSDAYMRQ